MTDINRQGGWQRGMQQVRIIFAASSVMLATAVTAAAGASRRGSEDRNECKGWAAFASGGKVYRAAVGAKPQELYKGDAAHACWSVDGTYVFFVKGNGEIWRMRNDGSEAMRIAKGKNCKYCPIGVYRPDPELVLYVEGRRFFTISARTGTKTEIHSDSRSYSGEIAMSSDGKRMAARAGDSLYKIVVGGRSSKYSPKCSASISPDGEMLTRNLGGHTSLAIYRWKGGKPKVLKAPRGVRWDNQKFAANSDEYIVYRIENRSAVGVVHVPTGRHIRIGDRKSEYPDFFVGELPKAGSRRGGRRAAAGPAGRSGE